MKTDVLEWARAAPVGARITYAELRMGEDWREVLGPAGPTALRAHDEGLVFLAQRRGGSVFFYTATRISERARSVLAKVSAMVPCPPAANRRGR